MSSLSHRSKRAPEASLAADGKTYFGYVDFTNDGQPFYVGIGNEGRVKFLKRNNKHTNVTKKHGLNREVRVEMDDWDRLCSWEAMTIYALKTYHLESDTGLGCNFTYGGDGNVGSRGNRGKKQTPEHRAKNSASHRGKKASHETRAKLSALKKGKPKSPEHRAKISAFHKGKPKSSEHRTKISTSKKGVKATPETRAKLCASSQKGKKRNPEQIEASRMTLRVTNQKKRNERVTDIVRRYLNPSRWDDRGSLEKAASTL